MSLKNLTVADLTLVTVFMQELWPLAQFMAYNDTLRDERDYALLPRQVLLCCWPLHFSGRFDQAGVDTRTESVPGPAVQSIDCPSLFPEHVVSLAVKATTISNNHSNNIQDIWAEMNGYGIWCKVLHGRKVSIYANKSWVRRQIEFIQQTHEDWAGVLMLVCVNKMSTLLFGEKSFRHMLYVITSVTYVLPYVSYSLTLTNETQTASPSGRIAVRPSCTGCSAEER